MFFIRPYTPKDWDGVCQVHDRSRPFEFGQQDRPAQVTSLKEDPESFSIQNCRLLVACEDDHIVGFSGCHDDFLGWLYVDPRYSGKGIGRKLLREALKYTGPHAWTITYTDNSRGIHLYESEGFAVEHQFDEDDEGATRHCCRLMRY